MTCPGWCSRRVLPSVHLVDLRRRFGDVWRHGSLATSVSTLSHDPDPRSDQADKGATAGKRGRRSTTCANDKTRRPPGWQRPAVLGGRPVRGKIPFWRIGTRAPAYRRIGVPAPACRRIGTLAPEHRRIGTGASASAHRRIGTRRTGTGASAHRHPAPAPRLRRTGTGASAHRRDTCGRGPSGRKESATQ